MGINRGILIRNILLIVVGAGMIAWAVITDGNSTFSGFGGGLLGVGIIRLFQTIRYRRDEGYREQVDIALSDERNSYIRMKAWSWTGYLVVIGCAAATVVCMFLKLNAYMQIFSSVVCGICVIYWICYLVLSRKY